MSDEVHAQGPGELDGLERIWTPHRMAYVRSAVGGDGCPFCIIPAKPDEDSLVVARGEHCYVVLNLHPYNPGHLMVLPYRHVAGLEELTPEESGELMAFTQRAVVVIRSISSPHAFNVGLNLGSAAGGSLAQHLHQHVVPRWSGDANFITVVGGTKTLPQLLAVTRDLIATAWSTAP
ncbi:HIT domain-containing protein [Nocardioides sp. AE5]|uniref:HIT family protein n=1 Tax=Nocardioides sp. AE5 TaxID=2962573 RepID=UPI0028813E2D|nr:HIT domain-containing protein [Nocardioides sp. AE5]MDT0203384.1 HIT domain-containing protein [Nocardioides sp. AE5]